MNTTTVSLPPTLELNIDLTDEQFFQLCQNNRDLKFERTASGELSIMPPTGSSTCYRNADLTYQLRAWSRQNQLGKSFDRKRKGYRATKFIYGEAKKCITSRTAHRVSRLPLGEEIQSQFTVQLNLFMGIINFEF